MTNCLLGPNAEIRCPQYRLRLMGLWEAKQRCGSPPQPCVSPLIRILVPSLLLLGVEILQDNTVPLLCIPRKEGTRQIKTKCLGKAHWEDLTCKMGSRPVSPSTTL